MLDMIFDIIDIFAKLPDLFKKIIQKPNIYQFLSPKRRTLIEEQRRYHWELVSMSVVEAFSEAYVFPEREREGYDRVQIDLRAGGRGPRGKGSNRGHDFMLDGQDVEDTSDLLDVSSTPTGQLLPTFLFVKGT